MSVGYLKFLPPENPLLKRWIKGYYVQKSTDPEFHSKITFYQNITTTISIYKDSLTESEGRLRRQTHAAGAGYHAVLVGLVDKYQEVEFCGPLDRLGIVFHPAGLNHFIQKPLGELLENHYSILNIFETGLQEIIPSLFELEDLEAKCNMLDQFYTERLRPFDQPEVFKAVEILTTADPLPKVDELAENLNLSRRTLLRKLKKHLGYSVEEYISVIKFRKALLNFQKANPDISFTDLALDSQYYDQADFNHQLKSRSGLTPRELFAQLDIQDDTLFWKT
ncbi:MAG: helix-turn-helix domain-containing protein [Bacteroidota bacterium]